jgi:hypothetical protein
VFIYLEVLIQKHNGFIKLLLLNSKYWTCIVDRLSYHVCDDTRQQQVLLVLVRAFLDMN